MASEAWAADRDHEVVTGPAVAMKAAALLNVTVMGPLTVVVNGRVGLSPMVKVPSVANAEAAYAESTLCTLQ